MDGEFVAAIPFVMYIDSVITHCCEDEYIQINNQRYKTEKIRNSLVHGRWYITADNCIILYDADPRNINDYNLEFIGKINISSFIEWSDNYIEQNRNKLNISKGTNKY